MNFRGKIAIALSVGGFTLAGANFTARAADDPLAWPPITAEAKPWAWWWWHGSAVDETNLTHELQRFHDAGLGGVQVTTIYGTKGMEARDIPYLTPQWLDMLGYTVDTAKRLGMGLTMTLGSGWCFGGPTVSDKDANASVVVKTFDVKAGSKLEEKFKRDATQALVAFSPDGKSIELTDKISATGEVDWTAPNEVGRASSLPDERSSASGALKIDSESPRADLAGKMPAPQHWTVYAISQKPSGQRVKRPGPGGEGWMLNPAYPTAMTDWLKWFDGPLANYHGSKPSAVFQDSYEYRTDWSPDFFAQFEKLRGYKLQTELPALFGDGDASSPNSATGASQPQLDHIARVKYDYRRTISEIMSQQSEPAWIDWAHKNGFQAIYQAHGTPANWLDLYGDADMPETEMFHNDRSILISKFASSAAHTQGRQFTGAETGTWLKEHFTETLADLKYLADDMFLSGVNRIFYHGACYSPDVETGTLSPLLQKTIGEGGGWEGGEGKKLPWPGWLFYASTEMNPRNPIWRDVPALNAYIARCQAVLQAGQPDNDVLLYWPVADFWSQPDGLVQPMAVGKTDWFESQPIGKAAKLHWERGVGFDYVSDGQLLKAKVADARIGLPAGIQMPGGIYKVIIIPECKYMPLETFEQLLALAEKGVLVDFEGDFPENLAGLKDAESRKDEFNRIKSTLLREDNKPAHYHGHLIGSPRVAVGIFPEPLADAGLSFIRRSFDGGWNYFVVNRSETNFDGWLRLGRPAKAVVILDPLTGNAGPGSSRETGQVKRPGMSRIEFHLQLAAGQSVILRAFADKTVEGPAWRYWRTNGQPAEISGKWKVKFLEGGPVLPTDLKTINLVSWTTFPDTNCQAFAGTAKYQIAFNAPIQKVRRAETHGYPLHGAEYLRTRPAYHSANSENFYLSLGDVRQSARVRVNGKDYGTLITPPFRVVVDNLKATGNTLEVEVTSVAANRIRDLDRRGVNWKYFKDINVVNENYKPFNAADWPLTDCGLLGPVTLTPVTAK